MEDQRYYIVNTATDLFLDSGCRHITMDIVAREGHISKKTIYLHFHNKKDLIHAVLVELGQKLSNQFQRSEKSANPLETIFCISSYALNKSSGVVFLNDSTLQHCYADQYKLLYKMLLQLLHENIQAQIIKGIDEEIFIPTVKVEEFCFILTGGLLTSVIKSDYMDPDFSELISIKDILYYFFRSIVTSKGLAILEKTFLNQQLLSRG